MYNVTAKTQDILQNTTIRPDKSGGWLAINTGTNTATVNGYPLAPGEGLDFTDLAPEVRWNSDITITLEPGAKVRLTRLQYTGQYVGG